MKKSVLFICTYNSVRSPMAEGLLEARFGDRYDAYSAGLYPSAVDPSAVAVMAELGIDISGHQPGSIGAYSDHYFTSVVFFSAAAREACFALPRARNIMEVNMPVPSSVGGIRRLRDGIDDWICDTFGEDR